MTTTIYTDKTLKFIEKAMNVHGDRYDYSKVRYPLQDGKVIILCKQHGSFFQSPQNHYVGKGCPSCSGNKKSTIREFISRSITIHGDRYDYSNSVYTGNKTKIEITCNIHNHKFTQVPFSHFIYEGCTMCRKEITSKGILQFISLANSIHNNKYDYSNSVYIDNKTKLDITCPTHGSFFQSPNVHTSQKSGCPKCFNEKSKWAVEPKHLDANDICYLYNIKITGNDEVFYKWGISNDYEYRHDRMTENTPYHVELISLIIDTRIHCKAVEKKLLKKYKRYKYVPDIKFGGYTECYIK